ncbi:hypothetical protein [Kitasatospora sp. NPDC050463]|uniref:hypothetical protein n=1 Tax=Kitasatospora sp. NPDC050463 TaxID=3155786 RepID=UPI003405A7BA
MADDRIGVGGTGGPVDRARCDRPGIDGARLDRPSSVGSSTDGLNTEGSKIEGLKAGGLNTAGLNTDGLNTDEQLVRVLLQRAVAEVQPDPAGLHRIRRAVPRRRAARRGAWTGAAALAVAVAIALPALHDGDHLGLSGGPGTPGAHGATPSATPEGSAAGSDVVGPNRPPYPDVSAATGTGSPSGSVSAPPHPAASSASTGGVPSTPVAASSTGGGDDPPVPLCLRRDLGQGASRVGAADGEGRIYGYFTVVNTSGRTCRLGGPGSVAVTGTSGTDPARIRVTDHSAGDPATDLPAPRPGAGDGPGLVLAPQAAYRVEFGWVPDGGCRATGGVSPSATAGQSGSSGSGAGTSLAMQSGGPGGPGGPGGSASGSGSGSGPGSRAVAPADGASVAPTGAPPASATPTTGSTSVPSPSATPTTGHSAPPATVTIAHTPAPGSPAAASAVLPGACSGTVYRTAPQPVMAPAPTETPAPSVSASVG